jgi:hypothetical protein
MPNRRRSRMCFFLFTRQIPQVFGFLGVLIFIFVVVRSLMLFWVIFARLNGHSAGRMANSA